ncbi:MAG: family glycosyltransferase,4-amino-4-deoxy-L-arabinose transferase [Phycisphaerales bacterium]|nr:family glycosyltransferase,4-amino-4-deoxy-L-arabinose transferase [Phycisphaerales bacterium]
MTLPPTDPAALPVIPINADRALAQSHQGRAPKGLPLLLFLLSLAMHVPFLGITPIAGTEGHRIFPAHEMVRSGWWMVPMLYDKPFLTKPPLHMWLIAISERIAGHGGVLVWRLPSAIAGALLCSAACWFGGRWFGKTAGLISGFCALGMITLWGQSQVADIDSTNTLTSALAAMCGIEMFFASQRLRLAWILAAGLAIGATLMTKGPAGLSIIAGVWVWGAIVAMRERGAGRIAHPSFWLPWLIGGAIFAAYLFDARASLRDHGLTLAASLNGTSEGTSRLYPDSLPRLFTAVFVTPVLLLLYGLPITISLASSFNSQVLDAMESGRRRIAIALAASVLIALAVCIVTGTDNPRYEYVVLPPLCPLAGAVCVAAFAAGGNAAMWMRWIVAGSVVALAIAAVGLAAAAWPLPHAKVVLAASAILALGVAAWTIANLPTTWRAAWGLAVLVLITAIPFGLQRHYDRSNTSGIHAGETLRQIAGKNAAVAVGGAVTSKPEVFYYAGARVNYFPANFTPQNVRPGTWVYLEEGERKRWLQQPGVRLERVTVIPRTPKVNDYLAWYP